MILLTDVAATTNTTRNDNGSDINEIIDQKNYVGGNDSG